MKVSRQLTAHSPELRRSRLTALSLGLTLFLMGTATFSQTDSKSFPTVVLCGKKHNALYCVRHDKAYWDYDFDGPLKDLESLPGYYLVTGGSGQVSLLKKEWKGCTPEWDWADFPSISVESAVVANWDEKDNPALILAADSAGPRLFLADAKAKDPKVRWEYKLDASPLRVHLCADTGNFLVILKNSTVEEVFYEENKTGWQLGPEEGLKNIRDALRDPWANTYVADAASGDVACFGPQKQLNWKTHLPFAPGAFEEMSLALLQENHKRMVMAAVHFSGKGSESQNVIYILNSETGKVTAWNDHDDKGGYPSFFKAVPDKAEYYKKQ